MLTSSNTANLLLVLLVGVCVVGSILAGFIVGTGTIVTVPAPANTTNVTAVHHNPSTTVTTVNGTRPVVTGAGASASNTTAPVEPAPLTE